jgi:hypothetical protein
MQTLPAYSKSQQGRTLEYRDVFNSFYPCECLPAETTKTCNYKLINNTQGGVAMLNLELPEEVYNRLELLALSTGMTMQFFALEAILEYLDEIEDRHFPRPQGGGQFDLGDRPEVY